MAGDAEPTGGDLLDRRPTFRVEQAFGVLAALTRVRLSADPVHRDRQRLVCFGRQRAVAHGPGGEPAHDGFGGFDFGDVDRTRFGGDEVEESAQSHQLGGLFVDGTRVLAEDVEATGRRRVLQFEDGLRVEQVSRAFSAPLKFAADEQVPVCRPRMVLAVGIGVPGGGLGRDIVQRLAAELVRGRGEVFVDDRIRQAEGFEGLRSVVGLDGRDAHLRHDLQQALVERREHIGHGRLGADAPDPFGLHEVLGRFHEQVRVDRGGTEGHERGRMVDLADVSGLDDDAHLGAAALAHQVMVQGRGEEQRRDRCVFRIRLPIREDEEHGPVRDCGARLRAQFREASGHRVLTGADRVQPRQRHRRARDSLAEVAAGQVRDRREFVVVDHRPLEQDMGGVRLSRAQQIAFAADSRRHARDDVLADGVQWRVRHLGEVLVEVVEEQPRAGAQRRDRGVAAHRAQGFGPGLGHRSDEHAQLFLRVPEGPLSSPDR